MGEGRKRWAWTAWDLSLGSAVGLLSGMASALFLRCLDGTIRFRQAHPGLLFLLPLFGLLSAWLYRAYGRESEGGGLLVLDEVLEFQGRVRSRLAPLVFVGALLTHLGGGSAGREGVAVQMGASLARTLGKVRWAWLRLTRSRQRLLLMAGMSGGFGSLFGTPVAGAVFGMEVLPSGRLHTEGLVVCAAASFVGDWTARFLGAQHQGFSPVTVAFGMGVAVRLLIFALPVALTAWTFSTAAHGLAELSRTWLPKWWMRPVVGGVAVILLASLFREEGYLNLGLPFLPGVFEGRPAVPWLFAIKLLFTVVTVGFGFKGGEVTPLFVIGALLGATCAPALGLPPAYLGAVGFVAVFAAASHTPLASALLGVELFGAAFLGPVAVTGFVAYVLVGHRGIYRRD